MLLILAFFVSVWEKEGQVLSSFVTQIHSVFSLYTRKKIFHHQGGQALENITQGGGEVPIPECV